MYVRHDPEDVVRVTPPERDPPCHTVVSYERGTPVLHRRTEAHLEVMVRTLTGSSDTQQVMGPTTQDPRPNTQDPEP